MGWSEDDALSADVNYVLVAYKGRMSMLQAIFGSSNPDADKKPPPTKKDILFFARTHNALIKHGRIRGVRKLNK